MLVTQQVLWIGSASEVRTAAEGLDRVAASPPDVIVIECPLPDAGVDELLEDLARLRTGALIVVHDPSASARKAVKYSRLGAHDVAGPGDDPHTMVEAALELRRGLREAGASPDKEPWRELLIGASSALQRTIEVIRLVGERRSTVLITGETGTGKEMVARALHKASNRSSQPMVAVNCNALPENLIEAELFGHVKGAFTGAIQQRMGRFEQANHGTLFLDEIGDLPLDVQTKLLRVLQEREFQRVGSSETVKVDVRLIAATHVNLPQRIREGGFREDLYYRLNVVPIATPPLRERPEDIPLLARHFVEKICRLEEILAPEIAPEALARLKAYSWPGNVRQLENAVEMAVALSGGRAVLGPSDFTLPAEAARAVPITGITVPQGGMDLDRTIGDIERQVIAEALRRTNGNKTAAAEILGLKRTTLAAKLKSLEASAG